MSIDTMVYSMNKEEIRVNFANAETGVYWDVEDFPVTDIVSFNQKIRLALASAGYHGKVSITAYGGKERQDESYRIAGITFVTRSSKRRRMHKMLVDMHFWSAKNLTSALTNVMVIAKNIMPDDDILDTGFEFYLAMMNIRCYNVLLAVPDDFQLEKMPHTVNYTVWRWSALLAGRNPVDHSLVFRPYPPPQERPPYLSE